MLASAFVALLSVGTAALGRPPAAGAGAATLDRGKAIYLRGEGRSEITAALGDTRLPASAVPCGGCHGPDGRGKPEGGVTPPDLRNAALTKPYAVTAGNARTRGPYDDRLLRRAITMGIDSSGNRLNKVMPRYEMARADLDALVAFLHTLGDEVAPGVSDHAIRAGVLLPPDGRAAGVRAAVEGWAKSFNAAGGVYGRTLEVRFASAAEALIRDENLFALFASFTERIGPAALPVLSAFDDDPDLGAANVRYLAAGIPQQARALARFAAESGTSLPVAIVRGASPVAARAAEAFAAEAKAAGFPAVVELTSDPVAAVLVLGRAPGPTPDALVLSIASLAGAAAFDGSGRRAIAFPTLPVKQPERAAALASAKIFAEALRETGNDLTRERFLQSVDALHRRGVNDGAWIVAIDADGTIAAPRFVRAD
jgi:ABC-type branched-subunit amino acid transport system substrate-binding protein